MIEEQARIVAVEGEDAWVAVDRKSVCGSCDAKKGCGTGVLTGILGRRNAPLRVRNTLGLKSGDWVTLGVNEGAILKGAVAMYLAPLLGLFIVSAIAQFLLGFSEPMAITAGLAAFVAVLVWVKVHFRKLEALPQYQPAMIRQTQTGVSVKVSRFDLNQPGH